MAEPILVPDLNDTLVDDQGISNLQFHIWMDAITDAVNNIPPLTGTGTPEGSITGSVGRWYVDKGASVGTGIYFKETGDGDTGWIARS